MYFQVCSNSAYPQHSGEQYRTNGPLVPFNIKKSELPYRKNLKKKLLFCHTKHFIFRKIQHMHVPVLVILTYILFMHSFGQNNEMKELRIRIVHW